MQPRFKNDESLLVQYIKLLCVMYILGTTGWLYLIFFKFTKVDGWMNRWPFYVGW